MTTTVTAGKRRITRDPAATYQKILDAATSLLASNGPDHLNVSQVAHLAGVNRGTAYKYFPTREDMVDAALSRMSDELFAGIFGRYETATEHDVTDISIEDLTINLIEFAMENPDLGRVWLLEILSSRRSHQDLFWQRFSDNFARFSQTERCEANVDAEVLSVLFLGAFFLWPILVNTRNQTEAGRKRAARRFSREILRLIAYGTVVPEKFHEMAASSAAL